MRTHSLYKNIEEVQNSFLYVCNGGNAAVLGVAWPLLLEAIPPRLAPVLLPL
jgi:hypothetical protein